jgi:hypothetical protein
LHVFAAAPTKTPATNDTTTTVKKDKGKTKNSGILHEIKCYFKDEYDQA